jgi:hypothetical protein
MVAMNRLVFVRTTALAAALIAAAAGPVTAGGPPHDYVQGWGSWLVQFPLNPVSLSLVAQSGPGGENPTGQGHYIKQNEPAEERFFDITCMRVDGSTVTLGGIVTKSVDYYLGSGVLITISDNGAPLGGVSADTAALLTVPSPPEASDCDGTFAGDLLQAGDFHVHDAP